MRLLGMLAMMAGACLPVSANAEIVDQAENGFVVRHVVAVTTDAETAYKMVRSPAQWWSGEHSWTGNAENFYMDAQAGGCFCELIPAGGDDAERSLRGSVQHMRILYADPGKMLRLSGALGPLQSEALNGTMTILFKQVKGGTEIGFEYVVGGYMRFPIEVIAPAVDGVIGEQASRLAMALGPMVRSGKAASGAEPDEEPKASKAGADEASEGDDAEAVDADADEEGAKEDAKEDKGPSLLDVMAGLGDDDEVAAPKDKPKDE